MKQIVLVFLSSSLSFAANLTCEIVHNNELMLSESVKTSLGEKAQIGSTQGVTAYVTERANSLFSIEAFVSQYEIRIYGQGLIKESEDTVLASLWGREMILDVKCRKP